MKNITTKVTLFIAAAALCLSINACKKSTTDSDISTAQDEAQAENESNFIQNSADAGAAQSTGTQPRSGGQWQIFKCATISFNADTTNSTKIMTITFNGNCTCLDGKVRSGEIIVTWNGRYRDIGTVIHTYTQNYTVNGNLHNYKKWVTNVGRVNGFITFDINDTATINTANGTISWISSRTRTWIQGSNDPWNWWDTEYSITGSASGTDRKGLAFTATITNPIIANFGCYWILVQGTYDLAVQGKAERIIDFGDGTCDDNATCTINGITYTFQFGNY